MLNPDTSIIDVIAISPITGDLEMVVIQPDAWEDPRRQLEWILKKINACIQFVTNGQISERPDWLGRPICIVVHCQSEPPRVVMDALVRLASLVMRDHRFKMDLGIGSDIRQRISLNEVKQQN